MNDSIWISLDRHFWGEASPEEAVDVERADPKMVREARIVWGAARTVALSATKTTARLDAAWDSVAARLDVAVEERSTASRADLAEPRRTPANLPRNRVLAHAWAAASPHKNMWPWVAVAAALIL